MMNFRKSVTKSGKKTFCYNGLSWQQRKQDKSNIDNFFERPSDAYIYIHCQNFISIEVAVQELGGRVTQPSLGLGVEKHLRRAKVKFLQLQIRVLNLYATLLL